MEETKKFTEERTIQGEDLPTPELNNVSDGQDCVKLGDGKWCFKPTNLSVKVSDPNWVFFGDPWVEVVLDNQGSAAWNMLDRGKDVPKDRFKITLSNPNEKRAQILSGSRSIRVRLDCIARYYPPTEE